jgi:cob(I)alamin adenosyltransferase
MDKLYTGKGDFGFTALYDTKKVSKSNITLSAIGAIDELSAHIGLLCTKLNNNEVKFLRHIQHKLLDLGSSLATTSGNSKTKIVPEDVAELEKITDYYHSSVPKLTEFILQGCSENDAIAHICRTVCRRAERLLWKLELSYLEKEAYQYMNRLSSYFFALARFISHQTNINEIKRSDFEKYK